MALKQTVDRFLKHRLVADKPVLLALSGGPDSLALYHALLSLNISFAVAHVDHGWRTESAQEAADLQNFVQVPFHTIKLDPQSIEGNLEDGCRTQRLHFFKELMHQYGYRALLMGHHADDQAETVLKRLFEGASFTQMVGMEETSVFEGMPIWRPFLSLSKKAILEYCQAHGLKAIDDYTNRDGRFLRARMRQTIIPQINQTFGKEVVKPLARISNQAAELKAYLDEKVQAILNRTQYDADGWVLDLNEGVHPIEIKHLLKYFLTSSTQIDTATTLIVEKKADKRIGNLYIHMGRIFYISNDSAKPCEDISNLIREEYKLTVDDE